MMAKEVKSNVSAAFEAAEQAAKDRLAPVDGIRTVCAQAADSTNERGDYQLDVQWTTTEGTSIRTRDTGMYGAQSFNLLMALWKVEKSGDHEKDMLNLNEAMAEETREVKFFAQPYKDNETGETKHFQKFRRVTAIDRAHATTEQMRKDGTFNG